MPTPETITKLSMDKLTPRLCLEYGGIGTGQALNRTALRAFIKKHGASAVRAIRESIISMTGHSMDELSELAPQNTFSHSRRTSQLKKRIVGRITTVVPFLQDYRKDRKEAGLRETGVMANEHIKEVIDMHFSDVEQVKLNNEVEMCNDAAQLLLMAHDDSLAPKVKFEAARKLLLMKFLGEINHYSEAEEDHEEALEYILNFMSERIYSLPKGLPKGTTFKRAVHSGHDSDTLATLTTKILTDEEAGKMEEYMLDDARVKLTALQARRTVVQDHDGKEREIYFTIDPRDKTANSRLIKTLRYNAHIGERDVDRNGLQLVFESRQEWNLFFDKFQTELEGQIRTNLIAEREEAPKERLPIIESRLRNLSGSIIIHDVKDSMSGNGFSGNSEASSEDLQVLKFKMTVTRADGMQHSYEFQIFLLDGYLDTKHRQGVKWADYNAKRFFEEGLDELFFPSHIYNFNHEIVRTRILKKKPSTAEVAPEVDKAGGPQEAITATASTLPSTDSEQQPELFLAK